MNSKSRDPCKGLEKGLKSPQDKLFDATGPLTQIFMLAYEAYAPSISLDPEAVRDWIQRGICLIGNASAAMSAERCRATLLHMVARLADMPECKLGGAKAEGKLFGDAFISEL